MSNNPFTPAKKIKRRLKVLLWGAEGTGKTVAALTFPGAAVIDAEDSTTAYAGREGVPDFMVMRTKSLSDLNKALAFIQQDNGQTIQTLVIDPITVFYQLIRDEEIEKVERKGKEFKGTDYGKVNRRMQKLYNTLTGLPVNVVVIAREADKNESIGGDLFKKVGVRPESDKDIGYYFDFKIHMLGKEQGFKGEVEKGRDPEGKITGMTLKRVTYEELSRLAAILGEGDELALEDEDLTNEHVAKRAVDEWRDMGVTPDQARTILGVERIMQWAKGRRAADELIRAALEAEGA